MFSCFINRKEIICVTKIYNFDLSTWTAAVILDTTSISSRADILLIQLKLQKHPVKNDIINKLDLHYLPTVLTKEF